MIRWWQKTVSSPFQSLFLWHKTRTKRMSSSNETHVTFGVTFNANITVNALQETQLENMHIMQHLIKCCFTINLQTASVLLVRRDKERSSKRLQWWRGLTLALKHPTSVQFIVPITLQRVVAFIYIFPLICHPLFSIFPAFCCNFSESCEAINGQKKKKKEHQENKHLRTKSPSVFTKAGSKQIVLLNE